MTSSGATRLPGASTEASRRAVTITAIRSASTCSPRPASRVVQGTGERGEQDVVDAGAVAECAARRRASRSARAVAKRRRGPVGASSEHGAALGGTDSARPRPWTVATPGRPRPTGRSRAAGTGTASAASSRGRGADRGNGGTGPTADTVDQPRQDRQSTQAIGEHVVQHQHDGQGPAARPGTTTAAQGGCARDNGSVITTRRGRAAPVRRPGRGSAARGRAGRGRSPGRPPRSVRRSREVAAPGAAQSRHGRDPLDDHAADLLGRPGRLRVEQQHGAEVLGNAPAAIQRQHREVGRARPLDHHCGDVVTAAALRRRPRRSPARPA